MNPNQMDPQLMAMLLQNPDIMAQLGGGGMPPGQGQMMPGPVAGPGAPPPGAGPMGQPPMPMGAQPPMMPAPLGMPGKY